MMKNNNLINEYIEKRSKDLSDRELLEEIYKESQSFKHKRLTEKMIFWAMAFAGGSLLILLYEFPPLWLR